MPKEEEKGYQKEVQPVATKEAQQLTVKDIMELMQVAASAYSAINFLTSPVIDPVLDYSGMSSPDPNLQSNGSQIVSSGTAGVLGMGLGYVGYLGFGALTALSTPVALGAGALYVGGSLVAMGFTARAVGHGYQYVFGSVDVTQDMGTLAEAAGEIAALTEQGRQAIEEGIAASNLLINALPVEFLERIDPSGLKLLTKVLTVKQDKAVKSIHAVTSQLTGAPQSMDLVMVVNAVTELAHTAYKINQIKNSLIEIKNRTEIALRNIEAGFQSSQAGQDMRDYLAQPGMDFNAMAASLRESMNHVVEQLGHLDVFSSEINQVLEATLPFRQEFSRGLTNHLGISSQQVGMALVNTVILSGEQYGKEVTELLSSHIISLAANQGVPIVINQGVSLALQLVSNMILPGSGGVAQAAAGPFLSDIRQQGERALGIEALNGVEALSERVGSLIESLNQSMGGQLLPAGVTGVAFAASYFAGIGIVGGGLLMTGTTAAAVTNPTFMGGMARAQLIELLTKPGQDGRDASQIIADIVAETSHFLIDNALWLQPLAVRTLEQEREHKNEHEMQVSRQQDRGQLEVVGRDFSYHTGRMASQALATHLQNRLNAYGQQHFNQDIAHRLVEHSMASSVASTVTSVFSTGLSFLWGGGASSSDSSPSPPDEVSQAQDSKPKKPNS